MTLQNLLQQSVVPNPIIECWMGNKNEKPTETEWELAIEIGKQIEKALNNSALVASQPAAQTDGLEKFKLEVCIGYFPTAMIWEY